MGVSVSKYARLPGRVVHATRTQIVAGTPTRYRMQIDLNQTNVG